MWDGREVEKLDLVPKLHAAGILVLLLSSYKLLGKLFDRLCLSFLICERVIATETIS